MTGAPFFTIFLPTYNRAYCLGDAIASCYRSTFRDFELIVIDDGSTDDTRALINRLKDETYHDLRYIYQKNQGKHVAFNHAVSLARGTLFLTLDSDDTLLEDALERISRLWQSMSAQEHEAFASIEFRCLENGVASSAYPEPYLDSTYVERRLICRSRGEKRSAYRVDVLREYPYPVFTGERYCRPGLIDIRIAKRYKTRFSNIIAIDAGHLPDGIGANRRRVIASAPRAYRQYFLEEIVDHGRYHTRRNLRSYYKRFSRSSFNARIGIFQQYREVPDKLLLLLSAPEAYLGSLADRLSLARSRHRSNSPR
ncbi:MAG: glycosyltransferase family 2 protein [Gammaproteobacteria bacterium]|nr:glycosyltransferase family 2 protein [Gammaproteobacteria bacterium]